MRKLIVLALLALTSGVAREAKALDSNDLAALQTAVHDLCVAPDQKGNYLKIEGDLNASAALKITGVNANAKVTKEEWEGINQQLAYKTDPRECAIKMMGILAPLFQQKNDTPHYKAVDISICNYTVDGISVAVLGYDVFENTWMKSGWANIRYGSCQHYTQFRRGMFYYYATRGRWPGNFLVCVDLINGFQEIYRSDIGCVSPYKLKYFSPGFVPDNGAIFELK
jgi:hypothetical protein